ncbi:MAG TPA: ABC transporter permease [Gemmatimonadaceae bacterium]|nr:ABC transporter permease [Gemmatimonadaceae bacterium]
MAVFLARRVAQGLVVVALAATLVFFLIHFAPGDPFGAAMENPSISEAVRESWRRTYGLDRPLGEQYVRYVASVFRGDLGFSFSHQRPVVDALSDAIPNTLLLMVTGLVGGFVIGIGSALAQVKNRGGLVDRAIAAVSLTFFSVPDFWLALLVLVAFSYWLHLFPIGGAIDPLVHDSLGAAGRFADRLKHLLLPAATLTLLYFPLIGRHQKAALLDVMSSEYVTTARAKGVAERVVINRHALRNALLPIIALVGIAFPALLTGAVFVEKVFSWPGMGLLIVGAINSRDYPLLTGAVIVGSVFVVTGSLLADILYRKFDPRLRDEF